MTKRLTRYRLRLKVEAIEKARKEMGLTQEEFAEHAGFSVSGWRRIVSRSAAGEASNVTLDTVGLICTARCWPFTEALEQIVET